MTDTEQRESAYRAVIGPVNRAYYLGYFHRADARGYAPISWHWPALLITLPWLLWRRLYLWAAITLGVNFVAVMTASVLAQAGLESLARPISLLIIIGYFVVYLPLQANAIYYRWAQARIEDAQQNFPGQPQQQLEWLSRTAGVDRNLPLYLVLLSLLVVALGQLAPVPPEGAPASGGSP